MAYQFKSYTGKNTDILHSKAFLEKSFKEREKIAFNKEVRTKISKEDKLLLQGYATAIAQRNKAYSYNNSNKKKSKNKDYKKATSSNAKPF